MRVFADFREVVIADAEYHFGGSGSPSGLPIPLCFSALELRSGRRFQLWDTELRRSSPPWSRDHDTLFVAFNAPAELLCYSVLNWPYPILTLDLLAEFRQATNGVLAKDAPRGLLAALQYYGLPHLDLAEKEEWRDLILSGGPFTADQRTGILAYNWTDIEGTQRLLKEMLPRLPANLDPCLYRGRYTAAVARTERIGIPVDAPTWENFLRKRDQVRLEITKDCPVYEKTIFSMGRFGALLKAWQLDHTWPHTAKTGIWSTKDRVFKDFSYHPAVERLRQVRSVVDQLDKPTFEVRHGLSRFRILPFKAQSGRNTTKACIFQSPSWLRAFIQPPPGWALIYADYEQEEFALAGILAQDTAMLTAYGSGDPYVPLAIQAGLVPRGGTKHTHPRERGIAKTLALSLLYGAGAPTLQRKAGISLNLARDIWSAHRQLYPHYWKWSDLQVMRGQWERHLDTELGWRLHVGRFTKPLTLRNFRIQGGGADVLRLAHLLLEEHSIQVAAPVHDAFLILCREREVADTAQETRRVMVYASEHVLGHPLRVEMQLLRWPDRLLDPRGSSTWSQIAQILGVREHASSDSFNQNVTVQIR